MKTILYFLFLFILIPHESPLLGNSGGQESLLEEATRLIREIDRIPVEKKETMKQKKEEIKQKRKGDYRTINTEYSEVLGALLVSGIIPIFSCLYLSRDVPTWPVSTMLFLVGYILGGLRYYQIQKSGVHHESR